MRAITNSTGSLGGGIQRSYGGASPRLPRPAAIQTAADPWRPVRQARSVSDVVAAIPVRSPILGCGHEGWPMLGNGGAGQASLRGRNLHQNYARDDEQSGR
jgi:hypothetical protein